MFTPDPIRKPFQTFNLFNRVTPFKSFQVGGLFGYSSVNYPAASCGVSEQCDANFPKGVTPECFYRGSAMLTTTLSQVGGPVPDSPGFPLKACGNDGLRNGNYGNAASYGESTRRD